MLGWIEERDAVMPPTAPVELPSCAACEMLGGCQTVTLQMVIDLDHCAVFEQTHPSVIRARADMTDLIGPWVLLREPYPKKTRGKTMVRKPETVRGLLGEIGRRLGVLDTRKAFQMPAKAMADALQDHLTEFDVNLEEVVATNDLDALRDILDRVTEEGDEETKPAKAAAAAAPPVRRGRTAPEPEEEEETPTPRRRGKPAAEEEEETPSPRRGRQPKAAAEDEDAPAARGRRGKPATEEEEEEEVPRRGRRGKPTEDEEADEAPTESAPAGGRGRRGKPAETGTGDGGAAVAALIADLRKKVDGNSEAIQTLSKLNVEIDRILTQTETLGQAVAFIANDYFQLGKKDKIGNVLNLDESLEAYINGGN